MKVSIQHISARQLSILFTIIAIILGSYSVCSAQFVFGDLGFISSLPITFFIALGFLTIASAILWTSPQNHSVLLGLQVCLLIFALWLAPLLIVGSYPYPAPSHPYMFWGFTEYIIRHGHFTPPVLWYLHWPGTWTLSAIVAEITGLSSDIMIHLAPMVLQFLFLLPLYVFLRNTLGAGRENYVWAGAWIFLLGNWIPQSYLGAQAFGSFLLLVTLALLSKTSAWQQGVQTFAYNLNTILVFACLAITHLFTAMATLAVLVALYVTRKVKDTPLVMLAAVIIAVWTMYGATSFLEGKLPEFIAQSFRVDRALWIGTVERATLIGSSGHQMVVWLRILTGLWVVAITVAGIILGRKTRRNGYADATVLAIGAGILLFAIASGAGYGFEAVQRIFLFSLPVAAYFGARLLNIKRGALVLCVMLLPLSPLFFVSLYGNIAGDTISRAHVSGMHFFTDQVNPGWVTGSAMHAGLQGEPGAHSSRFPFDDLQWRNTGRHVELVSAAPNIISINKHEEDGFEFFLKPAGYLKRIQVHLERSTNVNLIYANPDMHLYLNEYRP